jgi:hypothetical protein
MGFVGDGLVGFGFGFAGFGLFGLVVLGYADFVFELMCGLAVFAGCVVLPTFPLFTGLSAWLMFPLEWLLVGNDGRALLRCFCVNSAAPSCLVSGFEYVLL